MASRAPHIGGGIHHNVSSTTEETKGTGKSKKRSLQSSSSSSSSSAAIACSSVEEPSSNDTKRIRPSAAATSPGIKNVQTLVDSYIAKAITVNELVSSLLSGELSSLVRAKKDMREIHGLLDAVFNKAGTCDKDIADEFLLQLGVTLHSTLLDRFYEIADNGVSGSCPIGVSGSNHTSNVHRLTHKVLSLVSSRYVTLWEAENAAQADEAVKLAKDFKSKMASMPPNTGANEVMKIIHKENSASAKSISKTAKTNPEAGTPPAASSIIPPPPAFHKTFRPELVALVQLLLKNGVLWSFYDLGNIETSTTVIACSFSVDDFLGDFLSARNAHKDGFVGGPCFASRGWMVIRRHLERNGEKCIIVDLAAGSFPANAFDKSVPHSAQVSIDESASILIDFGGNLYGLGVHTNKALKLAAESVYGQGKAVEGVDRKFRYGSGVSSSSVTTVSLQHTTVLSPHVSSNQGALFAATNYDRIFPSINDSHFGRVLLYGLRSDKYGGVGGPLSAVMCQRDIEKQSNVATATGSLHPLVAAFCARNHLANDEDAVSMWEKIAVENLDERLVTRTFLYLSEVGKKGGDNESILYQRVNFLLNLVAELKECDESSDGEMSNADDFDGRHFFVPASDVREVVRLSKTDNGMKITLVQANAQFRAIDGRLEGGDVVRELCDIGSKLSGATQSAATVGFDTAISKLKKGEHAHERGKTGAFMAVREKQRIDGTADSPGAIDEARAAAVFAACVGGGLLVRELCERGKNQSPEIQNAAASGYSKGGGKAGAFVSVRSYQASHGTADDDEAFYEARAAAVYAACTGGGKEGGLARAEADKAFDLTIEARGGSNKMKNIFTLKKKY